jgi:hypothetical protein
MMIFGPRGLLAILSMEKNGGLGPITGKGTRSMDLNCFL